LIEALDTALREQVSKPADLAALAQQPLVIVGHTASGKSNLAMGVARLIDGAEIVNLDAMQVYRGMDIGTATPSAVEMDEVPHHLVNLVDPTDDFTVAEMQHLAQQAIAGICARGGVPILAGGTGLYVRAVIDRFDIPGQYPQVRAELETESDTAALHRRLAAVDPVAAERMEPSNRRRVLRALEVTVGSNRRFSSYGPGLTHYPSTPFVQVGLQLERSEVDQRIAVRFNQQLDDGFVDEVMRLSELKLSRTACQALGYKELLAHLTGETTLEDAVELALQRIRRFARRQQRWFRRDPRICWLDTAGSAEKVLDIWQQAVWQRSVKSPNAVR